jgi:hypothetical protein
MTITAFIPPGTGAGQEIAAAMEEVARRLSRIDNTLRIRILRQHDKAYRPSATKAGLKELRFAVSDNRSGVARGFAGFVFAYRGTAASIPEVHVIHVRTLQYWLAMKIEEVRLAADGGYRRVGLALRRGSLPLRHAPIAPAPEREVTAVSVVEQAFPFYRFVDADLAAPIHTDLDAIIVSQPAQPYSIAELKRLDEFVMAGKSVAIFASAAYFLPRSGT